MVVSLARMAADAPTSRSLSACCASGMDRPRSALRRPPSSSKSGEPTGRWSRRSRSPPPASGAMQPFTMAGSATSEGGLALSASGHYLTAAGYATPPGTASVASTTAATVFRSAARIDAAGNVDTSTSFSTAESGYNARSAVSARRRRNLDLGRQRRLVRPLRRGHPGGHHRSGGALQRSLAGDLRRPALRIVGQQRVHRRLHHRRRPAGHRQSDGDAAARSAHHGRQSVRLRLLRSRRHGGGERHALPGRRFGRSAEVDLRRQQLERRSRR